MAATRTDIVLLRRDLKLMLWARLGLPRRLSRELKPLPCKCAGSALLHARCANGKKDTLRKHRWWSKRTAYQSTDLHPQT